MWLTWCWLRSIRNVYWTVFGVRIGAESVVEWIGVNCIQFGAFDALLWLQTHIQCAANNIHWKETQKHISFRWNWYYLRIVLILFTTTTPNYRLKRASDSLRSLLTQFFSLVAIAAVPLFMSNITTHAYTINWNVIALKREWFLLLFPTFRCFRFVSSVCIEYAVSRPVVWSDVLVSTFQRCVHRGLCLLWKCRKHIFFSFKLIFLQIVPASPFLHWNFSHPIFFFLNFQFPNHEYPKYRQLFKRRKHRNTYRRQSLSLLQQMWAFPIQNIKCSKR